MTWGIQNYSATPSANTQINGINIAPGCPSSSAGPFFRQIMADIKAALDAQIIGVPAGAIFWFHRTTAPTAWQALDGSAISRAANPILFADWGTTYGTGDGSTTFNVPDWRGRTPIGYDPGNATGRMTAAAAGGLSAAAIGNTGGDQIHTLTQAELPAHTHTATTTVSITDPGHAHTYGSAGSGLVGGPSNAGVATPVSGNTGASTTGITATASTTVANTGGGDFHNNVQPSIVALPCVKLG